MRQPLLRMVGAIDWLNERLGRLVAWLTLGTVLITFAVAMLRYGFGLGWVWLQESYIWLHAIVFTLGSGYTLLHDGHVRIDIFYRPGSGRYRAIVDLLGSLLLLIPTLAVVFWMALPYVRQSWVRLEGSREAGGLPGLFLLKSVLLIFCIVLLAQGLALAGRSLLRLTAPAGPNADRPAPL